MKKLFVLLAVALVFGIIGTSKADFVSLTLINDIPIKHLIRFEFHNPNLPISDASNIIRIVYEDWPLLNPPAGHWPIEEVQEVAGGTHNGYIQWRAPIQGIVYPFLVRLTLQVDTTHLYPGTWKHFYDYLKPANHIRVVTISGEPDIGWETVFNSMWGFDSDLDDPIPIRTFGLIFGTKALVPYTRIDWDNDGDIDGQDLAHFITHNFPL